MRVVRELARLIAAAILLGAAGLAFRAGLADVYARQGDTQGLEKAVRLEPGDGQYHRWLGVTLLAVNPSLAEAQFQEAVRLNPWDADARMRLAVMHESQGKPAQAEQELIETTKWGSTFLPRWALVNLEYRQGKIPEFWFWARKAIGMSYGDRTPIFDLAAATGETDLAKRLGLEKDDAWVSYLWWALAKASATEIQESALHVAQGKLGTQVALTTSCDRLLDLAAVSGALEVWNLGVKNKVIESTAAVRGRVTNGNFALKPAGAALDWVVTVPAGGFVAREGPRGGLRIHFNGDQCEQCPILTQRLAVTPGDTYRLRVKYRTSELTRKSGLRWSVASSKAQLEEMKDGMWAEEGGTVELTFRTPRDVETVRITMMHRRPEGEVRTEGTILIEDVEIAKDTPPTKEPTSD